jgi:hypothetical protein
MDPYLESRWSDIHASLIAYIGDTLQPNLPRDLRARADERPVLGDPTEFDRFVKIIDIGDRDRIVTTLEVLTPETKSVGRQNDDYLSKLDDYQRDLINVVEIDLLRSPRDLLPIKRSDLSHIPRSPYLILIRPVSDSVGWEIYPVSLRDPLPNIRIPLRKMDTDIVLELQPLIERAYVGGGHDDIDYSKPPNPPLDPDDEKWADELLRAAGRR